MAEIDTIDDFTSSLSEGYMSLSPDDERDLSEALLHGTPIGKLLQETGIDDVDTFVETNRTNILEVLDQGDEKRQKAVDEIESYTASCADGPLKMRAKKAGQVITATVCLSPDNDPGRSCERVYVDRRSE